MYRKGFWLILIEDDGSEIAVACQILSREEKRLQLRAHIPPSWYPQTFTSFKVRQDGDILGWQRLPADALISVPAHAGLHSVDLEFSLGNRATSSPAAGVPQPLGVPGD
jgi:hypothetical protein